MLEDSRRGAVQPGVAELDPVGLARADQLALLDQLGEERRGRERAPVREAALGEDAKDPALGPNDPAVRVAKGSGLEVGGRAGLLVHLTSRGQLGVPSSSGRRTKSS